MPAERLTLVEEPGQGEVAALVLVPVLERHRRRHLLQILQLRRLCKRHNNLD